jgi:hypothetical protein
MAKLSVLAGATSQSINVFIQDSTSTTGAGLTAVAPASGSLLTGTTAYYSFSGTNAGSVTISLSVLASVGAAWTSGGIVTIDDTHMAGWVRIDLPNAVIAASKGRSVSLNIYGGTHMAQCPVEIELTGWDNQNATTGGMAALPNAAAAASGGLPTVGTGSGQINPDGTGAVPVAFGTALPSAPVANSVGEALYASDIQLGRINTARAGTSTTIQLDSGASTDTNAYVGDDIYLYGGTGGGIRGSGQRRTIVAYNTSTQTATVNRAWDTNPTSSTTFMTIPTAMANIGLWSFGQVPSPSQTGVPITDPHYWNGTAFVSVATAGIPDVNVKNIVNAAAQIDGNNLLKVDLVDIAGSALSTTSAQIGVNLVNIAGSAVSTSTAQLGVNLVNISGSAVSATTAQLGVNVVNWNNHVVATPNVAGVPITDTGYFGGHATVLDGNNYPGVNIVDVAGQAASYYTGQAQTGGATSITLASGETNNPLNCEIAIVGGTGAGQKAKCTAWNSSTKVATTSCPQGVSGAWVTNPDSTSLYAINDLIPNIDANGRVDLGEILGTASAGTAGYVGLDWSAIHAPTTSVSLSGTTISTSQAVASVSGAVGSVTGNVGGNVVGSVASVTGAVGSVTAVVSANVTEWSGTNVAGAIPPDIVFLHSGTAQAGGASTITLDSGASSTNNLYQNQIIFIRSGTGAGQSAIITSYVGSTKVATIVGSWASNPDNTSVFTIMPFGSITTTVSGGVNVTQWNGSAVGAPNIAGVPLVDIGYTRGSASTGAAGSIGIDWAHVANPTSTVSLSGTTISTSQAVASVSGAVGSVTGSVGSVTGSVGSVVGNVGGSVASVTGAVGSVTGSVGSISGVTFPGNFGTLSINTSGHVQIQGTIQKNTALNGFMFYMALTNGAVPHYSPATGLTITSTVSLNGGAFASTTNNATEIGSGWYAINLAAADVNGNVVTLSFAGTGADTTYMTFTTQP